MCKDQLITYLQEQHIAFETQQHRVAFTAQDVATSERIRNDMMAKVVIVVADGNLVMLVLPASYRVNFVQLPEVIRAKEVWLASETEVAAAFPDCEVGAMPPFGNLYNLPVYVDSRLAAEDVIVFQVGTHTDTIHMKYADFARLVEPKMVSFAAHFREMSAHLTS